MTEQQRVDGAAQGETPVPDAEFMGQADDPSVAFPITQFLLFEPTLKTLRAWALSAKSRTGTPDASS